MDFNILKKVASLLLVVSGSIALIFEIASTTKNYYLQSLGIVALMLGLYLVNSKLTSTSEKEASRNPKHDSND
ncbi:hypothetical protein J8281_11450 [Aquimarina sp. U1-2]|uniref:hypothetical protein n=1 Tax=Aquimarina sp. U1-2 TaxID=2823141 RepID=UPI001AECBB95|nr:hypothetical protein [Aquimarina sp. U1-2]MBP2832802.1 hypothetical protein [Aquimarina sp. U1-2]